MTRRKRGFFDGSEGANERRMHVPRRPYPHSFLLGSRLAQWSRSAAKATNKKEAPPCAASRLAAMLSRRQCLSAAMGHARLDGGLKAAGAVGDQNARGNFLKKNHQQKEGRPSRGACWKASNQHQPRPRLSRTLPAVVVVGRLSICLSVCLCLALGQQRQTDRRLVAWMGKTSDDAAMGCVGLFWECQQTSIHLHPHAGLGL